jgi:hypothetical protein
VGRSGAKKSGAKSVRDRTAAKFRPISPRFAAILTAKKLDYDCSVIEELKAQRQGIRLSLSGLARKAGVSRFRLWAAENGELVLTPQELARLRAALHGEAARIENIFRDFVRAEV